jgi:hypothetical protein
MILTIVLLLRMASRDKAEMGKLGCTLIGTKACSQAWDVYHHIAFCQIFSQKALIVNDRSTGWDGTRYSLALKSVLM